MKKVVPKLLIISSQILIGALFVFFTIRNINFKEVKIDSKEMEMLSQVYYKEEQNAESQDINNEVPVFESLGVDNQNITEPEPVVDNYFMNKPVLSSYVGILTGYGPDCYGCGDYTTNRVSTSSGYHIADIVDGVIQPAFTITYDDYEFGNVRIVAADSSIPYNSIVRITIPGNDPIMAIVLDRGATVGFDNCRSATGCLTNFDLLAFSESEAIPRTFNVTFEILRIGG